METPSAPCDSALSAPRQSTNARLFGERRSGLAAVWALLTVLLVGCAANASAPRVTMLPTAVPPSARPSSVWAVAFAREFPPRFWPAGAHTYTLLVHCPPLEQPDRTSPPHTFVVDADGVLQEDPIYFRLGGPSYDQVAPIGLGTAIHPDQKTVAVVTIVGIPQTVTKQVQEECEVLIRWDGQLPQSLAPQEPFQPYAFRAGVGHATRADR